jgi:Fe-S-cluster containining protein
MNNENSPASTLKCNGCTACCRGFQVIMLHPNEGDVPENYDPIKLQQHPTLNGAPWPDGLLPDEWKEKLILKHKENGDCIYLEENGCTIYDKRPVICRSFDCRINYMRWTKARRNSSNQNLEVWKAAKSRLHTMTGKERLEAINQRKQRNAS